MIKFTISWQLKPLGQLGESVSHSRGSVRIIVKWLNHPIQTAEAFGISSSFITIYTPIYIRANRKSHAPNNVIGHLTLKLSHEDATSLLTVTFIPPPFSADTYFCNVTDLNCTSVPSCIAIPRNGSAKSAIKNPEYIQEDQDS